METKDLFSPAILEGKISLVTGAGRGLGKVMAQTLADAGSALILIARRFIDRNEACSGADML